MIRIPAVPTSSGGSGITSVAVIDHGTATYNVTALNFTGAGVTAGSDANSVTLTIASGGGAGTVTNVGVVGASQFSITGSPVTAAGTITLGFLGLYAVDKSTATATVTAFDFIGAGISYSAGGGTATISVAAIPTPTTANVGLVGSSQFSITGSPAVGTGTLTISFVGIQALDHSTATATVTAFDFIGAGISYTSGGGTATISVAASAATTANVGLASQDASVFGITGSPAVGTGTITISAGAALCNTTATQTITNKQLTNPFITAQVLTPAGTVTWNMASGNWAEITLTANLTMATPLNMPNRGSAILKVVQGNGSDTVTAWGAGFKWAGAAAPTLSTASAAVDFISFAVDGSVTQLYGLASTNYS